MPTQRKTELVEEFSEKFKSSKSIFLADFSGINVAETTKLRRSFREAKVEYRVLKNNLAKLSFKDAGIEGFGGFEFNITGPLSIIAEVRLVIHDIADTGTRIFKPSAGIVYYF